MTNEKNAMQEAARTVRAPQRVSGFDPMKFARKVENEAGDKVLTLDLNHKKAWFRMACPNGGVVLHPLRVTDQMAIFEARLFADTGDSNPLSSFIAARTADKSTGQQYIRAAQEDALNEALENAGFGLPLIPTSNDSGQRPEASAGQSEAGPETVDGGQPPQTPPVAEPKQAAADEKAAPNEAPPVQQPKTENKPAPRPAPVAPPPRAAETPRPAPVAPQPRRDAGTVTSAPAVVDISTAKPAGEVAQPAVQQTQTATVMHCNPNVSRGASKVHQLAVKNGLKCRRLVWNPNYKGIDDWLLALHKKKYKEKERVIMNFKQMYLRGMCPFDYIEGCAEQWRNRPDIGVSAEEFLGLTHEEYEMFLQMNPGASLKAHLDGQRRTQKFRVYQLDLMGAETCPFAFRGLAAMLDAGYQQPPAGSYQLVYDGEITHPKAWTERDVLEYVFAACNDDLPEGYQGRSLSMSDVVELYDGDNRDFFYCERCGFTPVRFDAEQAKPMQEVDEDG